MPLAGDLWPRPPLEAAWVFSIALYELSRRVPCLLDADREIVWSVLMLAHLVVELRRVRWAVLERGRVPRATKLPSMSQDG
jgi:hypothetical protein